MNQNQFKIRREFRTNLTNTITSKLELTLKRYNLSRTDFAKLMTKKKLGTYGSWSTCFRRICDLFNGRYPSDEFCANIYNVIDTLDNDPKVLNRVLKTRSGFSKFTTGQSITYRDNFLGEDKTNTGRIYLRKMLRKAIKNA